MWSTGRRKRRWGIKNTAARSISSTRRRGGTEGHGALIEMPSVALRTSVLKMERRRRDSILFSHDQLQRLSGLAVGFDLYEVQTGGQGVELEMQRIVSGFVDGIVANGGAAQVN
jgi:hypothetical protein